MMVGNPDVCYNKIGHIILIQQMDIRYNASRFERANFVRNDLLPEVSPDAAPP